MGRLQPKGDGHIELLDGTRRVWSSDGPPINLLPQANWLTIPVTIAFPDFIKRNAYCFAPQSGIIANTSCASFSTIIPQEWGPGEPSPRTLPDQVLGTVPSGVNYIDVRLTVNRTKAPTALLGIDVPNSIPTQQTPLPGGTMPAEITTLWRRLFEIGLNGTQIRLRRWQSVFDGPTQITWAPGNQVWLPNGGKRPGWTHGGGSDSALGHPAHMIQRKAGGNVNKERGGSNQCSLSDNSNFASTWTGTALIRPGYIAS
jgi:hypothetical protein